MANRSLTKVQEAVRKSPLLQCVISPPFEKGEGKMSDEAKGLIAVVVLTVLGLCASAVAAGIWAKIAVWVYRW
jgi:hypothetical protein